MFKILILQAWYGLSDEALEKQIARDLMFRRFIDLSLSEVVPDHATSKNLVFPAVFLLYFSIFSPFPLIGRNNPLDFIVSFRILSVIVKKYR
jgi:hypothetical protein